MRVDVLTGRAAARALPEVGALYRATFIEPPYLRSAESVRSFADDVMPEHGRRAGFTLVAVRDPHEALVGYAYGYDGARGQHWTEMVLGLIDAGTAEHWHVGRHREVAEVALAPHVRGWGLGRTIVTRLLQTAPASATQLLSTHERADPARRLYESLGFESFARTGEYLIMGRRGTSG